ncbi:asparaginase-domain-containing protein [Piromyces finnis]|uniref:asparaginase n=1 Tax=Piromyces finnis TaxID=1754191 RepID=A0A1Y1V1P7_9FUNG|nr:asparaginase-domain-containing protein [Piromyces finnis]|eukprot:ORX45211.1 asparaginase-domain-containing protein [Piromyces finnis]
MNKYKKIKLDDNEQEKNFYNSATVHEQVTVESTEMFPMNVSKVLILYTGGTIGMKMTADHVYCPVTDFFTDLLLTMRQFHDPNNNYDDTIIVNTVVKEEEEATIPKSEITIINNIKTIKKKLKALVTPVSLYGKRTIYTIYEYDELIDSANLTLKDWVKIATDIEINYNLFDAFIILHGTDTMAYSASALSFMLENLGKTVILTGSQVPLSEVRNDAVDNLLGALTIASHYIIPEVTLFFNQKLFRGNRTKKVDATNFNAFDSPNMKPLVKLSININVSWKDILRPTEIAKFHVHKNLNHNIALLQLFPGISYMTLKSFLSSVEGVVLESYGAGNAPDKRKDILQALKEATDRGIIIVNCTQCTKGSVSDIYATGKALTDAGLISGKDMTTECALAKLSYLLGKNISKDSVKQLIKTNLRGELTDVPKIPRFSKFINPDNSYIVKIINLIKSNENNKRKEEKIGLDDPTTSNIVSKEESDNDFVSSFEEKGNNHGQDNTQSRINKILLPSLYRTAASTGDIAGLNELLEGWPYLINNADNNRQTGLHLAAKHNHLKTSEFLIKMGCIVHTRDIHNHTPLWYAVTNNFDGPKKQELIQLLVKSGAIYASDELNDVKELLFRTAKNGNLSLLKHMISSGADINVEDGENRNIIHMASIYKNYDILYYLKDLDNNTLEQDEKHQINHGLPIENNFDSITYCGTYIIEEMDKTSEEAKKVKDVLKTSDPLPTTNVHKLKWNQVDRWNKTPLNYLKMELKIMEEKIMLSNMSMDDEEEEEEGEEENKSCNALMNEKIKLEKVINDIFMPSFISVE